MQRTRIVAATFFPLTPALLLPGNETREFLRPGLPLTEPNPRWRRVVIWRSPKTKGVTELYAEIPAVLSNVGANNFRANRRAVRAIKKIVSSSGKTESSGEFAAGQGQIGNHVVPDSSSRQRGHRTAVLQLEPNRQPVARDRKTGIRLSQLAGRVRQ